MDNDLWKDKPFARGQAWVDMIMLANHADNKVWFDGKLISVRRGEFITSIRKLSERWGWSRNKTKLFLSQLESDQMVGIKRASKRAIIYIENYQKYQGFPDEGLEKRAIKRASKGPVKDQSRASEGPVKDTNNNEPTMTNNEEEKNKPAAPFSSDPEDEDEGMDAQEAYQAYLKEHEDGDL